MSREPTQDEAEGMAWWNGLSALERELALRDAGWVEGGYTPSAAEAWALHKQLASLAALRHAMRLNFTQ